MRFCSLQRFQFKIDLANCQPGTAPLELNNNNNKEKRQGKCPSDHDHDHSNTIEIVGQSSDGDIVIGCLSQFKSFAIAFGISVPIFYVGCEMFNLPAFTYHPATNRIGFGWEAGRSGEGPAMYWYGWTVVTLVAGLVIEEHFILGLLATLLPEGVAKKIPLALLWLLPILALVPLAYSLMPFWTK
jgi:hypothetical protein